MTAVDDVERLLALADDDEAVERAARGVAQVERATRRYHAGPIRPVHVTLELAGELGWPLCGCGRGGIRPGACVQYRGLLWHAECAVELARAAA